MHVLLSGLVAVACVAYSLVQLPSVFASFSDAYETKLFRGFVLQHYGQPFEVWRAQTGAECMKRVAKEPPLSSGSNPFSLDDQMLMEDACYNGRPLDFVVSISRSDEYVQFAKSEGLRISAF